MKNILRVVAVLMMGLVGMVRGEGFTTGWPRLPAPVAGTREWEMVARYVDDQTLVVGHLDVGKVDLAAVEKFVNEVLDAGKVAAEGRQGLAAMWTMLAGYKARFEKLGGRQVYLLISHPDAWPGMEPVAVLLPLEKGGDAQGMVDFLKGALGEQVTVSKLGEDLVYVGQALPLKRFGTMKAVKRPDIEAGLMASGGGALQVVVAPTADVRRAVAELLPRLPAEVAGDPLDASTEFLTKGLGAVTLRVDLPPGGKVRLSFETGDQEDAVRVAGLLTRILERVKSNQDFVKETPAGFRDFVGTLKPATGTLGAGDAVRHFTALTLDEQGVLAIVTGIMPVLDKERLPAKRSQSAANIRGVISACTIYASNNKDEWPASLDVLVKEGTVNEKMLVNPLDPKHRRYEYHRWTKEQIKKLNWPSTPVVWEVVDDEQTGLNIGYLDCHVDFCASRKQLEDELKKAEELVGGK